MKFKKALLGLTAVAAVAAPVAATVACDNGGNKIEYPFVNKGNAALPTINIDPVKSNEDIAFITDGGSITDKSFNEGALYGVKGYAKAETKKYAQYLTSGGNNPTKANFDTSYKAADASSAKSTFVIAGFKHTILGSAATKDKDGNVVPAVPAWDKLAEHKVVAIDVHDANDDQFYGIEFKTEQSGFLAAYESGFQLNKQYATEKSTDAIKVATFGGLKIPTVTAFMNGFAKGVEYFNKQAGTTLRKLELVHIGGNASNDFSNSFEAGAGKAIANQFINLGVRAIMPVAGPQTGDVVEAIKEAKKQGTVFAIGVDVDQSATYGGIVIGSAVKGLAEATKTTLELINKNDANNKPADRLYELKDNTNTVKYVGYVANSNYASDITSTQITDAETAAKDANAFANPLWQ